MCFPQGLDELEGELLGGMWIARGRHFVEGMIWSLFVVRAASTREALEVCTRHLQERGLVNAAR